MSDILDNVTKALASGVHRRQALLRLAGGAAAFLPFGAAGADFSKYLNDCNQWCQATFHGKKAKSCVRKAKKGKGPCYSATTQGPGYVCTTGNPCPANHPDCCPSVTAGRSSVMCCLVEVACTPIDLNGTAVACLS